MKIDRRKVFGVFGLILCFAFSILAQNSKPKTIIFGVLNDGSTLEPIAFVEKGKLTPTVNGSDESTIIAAFNKTYYKPKTVYSLIFGGVKAGSVTVKSSDPKSECAANMANVTFQSTKAKLKGLVMALATNGAVKSATTGLRRLPTAAERAQIETLVRAEFTKQKVAANAQKNLHYHNLTALDVNSDGSAELVGSYWVETSKTERALLFFIADKNKSGKYALDFSEFKAIKESEVMSGEIKHVDEGIYNELLLDVFDYDGDGTGEIFTYVQSFEGSGFNVYRREDGEWAKSFEGSNYHCGY
jgi:hypothetical protein